jgi:hypothetical protein
VNGDYLTGTPMDIPDLHQKPETLIDRIATVFEDLTDTGDKL